MIRFCLIFATMLLSSLVGTAQRVHRFQISPGDTITLLPAQVIVNRMVKERIFSQNNETAVVEYESWDHSRIATRMMEDKLGGMLHILHPTFPVPCDTSEFRNLMKEFILKSEDYKFRDKAWSFNFGRSLDCLPIDHKKSVMFLYMEIGPLVKGIRSTGVKPYIHSKYIERSFDVVCVLINPRDGSIRGLKIGGGAGDFRGKKNLQISDDEYHGVMRSVLAPFIQELERHQKLIDSHNKANKM